MTFSKDDPRPQVNVRIDQSTHETLHQLADQENSSVSELVRNALTEYLPESEAGVPGPADPELRKVWQWLHSRANAQGIIPTTCLSDLAQNLGIKKQYVKSSRLKPLEHQGWIIPNYEFIMVLDEPRNQEARP